MTTQKYVLSIGDCSGQLAQLAPQLKALGLQVVQASSSSDALKHANTFPLLSLVVIEQKGDGTRDLKLLEAIKDRNSDLPIIWIRPPGTELAFEDARPEVILDAPADAEELKNQADALLCQHFYPSGLVDKLVDATHAVLHDTFLYEVQCSEQVIRANRSVLAEVNALITFCGDTVDGRMIVSGSLAAFRNMFTKLAGEDSHIGRDDAADAAGEICNQALGRFKRDLETEDEPFELTVPILISGQDIDMRFKASRPALVLKFGELYIEFCFNRYDKELIDHVASLTSDSDGFSFF